MPVYVRDEKIAVQALLLVAEQMMADRASDRLERAINAQPKQQQFLDAALTKRYLLYGGAAGPGKSHILRWGLVWFHVWLRDQGIRNVATGLFSEDYPTLRDRQITRIKREFPEWLGELKETRDEGLGFYFRPDYGGGLIRLRNLDDPSKYASAEFAAIAVEELTKNPRETFDDLRFRLRWPGVSHNPFLAASNPGSIGHAWVKKLWIDRDFSGDDANLNPEWFKFIPALPRDNPFLDESYWETLHSLPPNMRRAMEEGDWNVFAGQAFSEWRPNLHIVDPFPIPPEWTRWTATDYGYSAPACHLWFARNPEKTKIYVYREWYRAGVRARAQAIALRDRSSEESIQMSVADPSMWARHEGLAGDALAMEYIEEGIDLVPANNNRIVGKNYVHEALAWKELPGNQRLIKEPRLQVFRNCENLIRTLPALPIDNIRPEDVDTDAEDHAYDALRYGLALEHQAEPKEIEWTPRPIRRAQAARRPG